MDVRYFQIGARSDIPLLTKLHGQRFSAIMSLTIRFQSFLLAVNSPKLFIVFSAVFVSMSNLMLSMDRSFLSISSMLRAVFQSSFFFVSGFRLELFLRECHFSVA